jgi:hypothetical protein
VRDMSVVCVGGEGATDGFTVSGMTLDGDVDGHVISRATEIQAVPHASGSDPWIS